MRCLFAGVAFRGLYIIDKKMKIRHIRSMSVRPTLSLSDIKYFSVNDMAVGRSVSEVLRLVQAFQLTDQSGEVGAIWEDFF